MNRSDFRFVERLRVRWSEVDLQKIVFNGHYLMYFDTAVAGYWRALAMPYHETMERLQGDLYVRKATLEYDASARYDDQLEVGMRCARIGNSSLTFEAAVFRGEQRLVHGELVYVFADPATQTSRPVPASLRELFEAYEQGLPVVDVRLGSWPALSADAQALRRAVFSDELQIPADLMVDAADADAATVHAVAYNRFGVAVASGRLVAPAASGSDAGRIGRIGRMAAVATLRGAGLGRAVLDALLDAARQRGDHGVSLHAQATAVAFYDRAGFRRCGDNFKEAGLVHVPMQRML